MNLLNAIATRNDTKSGFDLQNISVIKDWASTVRNYYINSMKMTPNDFEIRI